MKQPAASSPSQLREAVILVGGRGTRLRPLVNDRPKPMAELAGRPFVEWLLLELRAQGIDRIIFCTGYQAEMIEAYFSEGQAWDLEIVYSRDPTPLGTAGALRHALRHMRSDPILVLNGDSYCRFDLCRLVEDHRHRRACATLWVVWRSDCQRYGTVELSDDGDVLAFHEKRDHSEAGFVNAGVYLLTRQVVQSIPDGRTGSLELDVFPRLIGQGLRAAVGVGELLDIGTPESYVAATPSLLKILGR